ncbi:hypothetical protein ACHAWF_007645 [Thalassiosira exigua]
MSAERCEDDAGRDFPLCKGDRSALLAKEDEAFVDVTPSRPPLPPPESRPSGSFLPRPPSSRSAARRGAAPARNGRPERAKARPDAIDEASLFGRARRETSHRRRRRLRSRPAGLPRRSMPGVVSRRRDTEKG